jgi:hypothetical protein
MTSPLLVPELVDSILDYLRNDTSTLRDCSVVVRAWTSPSQRHLFSRIALSSVKEAGRLGCTFRDAPWLAKYVCTMDIQNNDDDPVAIHNAIGMHLPHLQLLRLHTNVTLATRQEAEVPLDHFTAARALEVPYANFTNLRQIQCLLPQFKDLDSLSFSFRTEWSRSTDEVSVQQPCHLRLRRLNVQGLFHMNTLLEFCSWMGDGQPSILPNIEVLEINVSALNLVDLERCAPTVRELHVRQFGTTWSKFYYTFRSSYSYRLRWHDV